MAVSHVDSTKYLDAAVNYTYKGKPHHDDAYVQGKRALMFDSVNASSNPNDFKFETKTFLKNNPMTRKGTATGIRTIISFGDDDLDYRKYGDRKKALAVGKWFAEHKYPHNQSLIVLQADGKNHWLHDHIITCARRLDNGLSSNSGATFANTRKYTDRACRHYGITPLNSNIYQPEHNTSIATHKIAEHNKHVSKDKRNNPKYHTYSYINDLHNRICRCTHISRGINEFYDNLQKYGVQLKPVFKMRKNKRTGQHQFHYYSHSTNNKNDIYMKLTPDMIHELYSIEPKIAKGSHLKNHQDEYVRYKNHFTYGFKDKLGKYRIVRDKKLGKDTAPLEVNKQFDRNIQFDKQHSIKELGIKKSKKTFTEYTAGNSSTKIHGVHKPFINKAGIKEPVMTFHPKSHELSKAINDLTSLLNKIKNSTQDGSDKRKEYLEQAYENSLLRKKQAEKVNEINDENRQIYAKISQDNYDTKRAYYQQQAAYEWELKKAQRQQWHQEFQR